MITYYTREVENSTDNIDGIIESLVAKTNQGFINSGVKMRIVPRCKLIYKGKTGDTLYVTQVPFNKHSLMQNLQYTVANPLVILVVIGLCSSWNLWLL